MIRFLDLAAGAVEAAELMAVHVKDCTWELESNHVR
jgi:hypothetical protein